MLIVGEGRWRCTRVRRKKTVREVMADFREGKQNEYQQHSSNN